MTPDALDIAVKQAEQDRALLARLIRDGKVMRDGPPTALTRALEARPKVNTAIRPRTKRRRR